MSVLINDMEMPKECGECAIYVCYRTWNNDPGDEFCGMTKENVSYKTKPDWCPLSEVPERKTGEWIPVDDRDVPYGLLFKCSECGTEVIVNDALEHNFCSECGCYMGEKE